MPFDRENLDSTSPVPRGKSYASAVTKTIDLVIKNNGIDNNYFLTAATPYASSLDIIKTNYPDNYIDVGMAEQHLVGIGAGIALKGKKPNIFVQSTFLQRSYDQIIHDLAFMDLNVNIFAVRSGFAGLDSPTHHAIFDLTVLPSIPNINVVFPSSYKRVEIVTKELLLKESTNNCTIVLLPYFPSSDNLEDKINSDYKFLNKVGILKQNKSNCLLISTSNSNNYIIPIVEKFNQKIDHLILEDINVFASTVDFINSYKNVFVLEENIDSSGLAARINLKIKREINFENIGVNAFPKAGSQNYTLNSCGMSVKTIEARLSKFIDK